MFRDDVPDCDMPTTEQIPSVLMHHFLGKDTFFTQMTYIQVLLMRLTYCRTRHILLVQYLFQYSIITGTIIQKKTYIALDFAKCTKCTRRMHAKCLSLKLDPQSHSCPFNLKSSNHYQLHFSRYLRTLEFQLMKIMSN